MSTGLMIACCCTPTACTNWCFKLTFSGVTLASGTIDAGFEGEPVEIDITSEGTVNGRAFYVCTDGVGYTATIPVAMRADGYVTVEDDFPDGVSVCGYNTVRVTFDTGTNTLNVEMGSGIGEDIGGLPDFTLPEDGLLIFSGSTTLPPEFETIISGAGSVDCTTASGITATVSNAISYEQYVTPLAVGGGSVTVEIVCNCNGEANEFAPACDGPGDFGQSICDDPDCPCGIFDDQPTCTIVTLKDAGGVDATYQNGAIIDGNDDRNYAFGTYYDKGDGTFWRFLIVTENDTVAEWGAEGSYFVRQCTGGGDTTSGTYTIVTVSEWTGSTAYSTLFTNHTVLTNIGTTVTVATCTCDAAEDIYSLMVKCDGADLSGFTAIDVERDEANQCRWVGSDGTWEAEVEFIDGEWTATVRRVSDLTLLIDATWTATGNDPTGTHGFSSVSTGYPTTSDAPLDEQCGSLAIEIS